jgi:hypothetical protein
MYVDGIYPVLEIFFYIEYVGFPKPLNSRKANSILCKQLLASSTLPNTSNVSSMEQSLSVCLDLGLKHGPKHVAEPQLPLLIANLFSSAVNGDSPLL